MNRTLIFNCILLLSMDLYGQMLNPEKSTVNIEGLDKVLIEIKNSNWDNILGKQPTTKLSSNDNLTITCSGGVCSFKFNFKDGSVNYYSFADMFDYLSVFEYDFGGEGVKELCYYFEDKMHNYAEFGALKYGNGMTKEIFKKEIYAYRLDVTKDAIEFFISNRLEGTWVFRKGMFHKFE